MITTGDHLAMTTMMEMTIPLDRQLLTLVMVQVVFLPPITSI
jgi:hypothetical protein